MKLKIAVLTSVIAGMVTLATWRARADSQPDSSVEMGVEGGAVMSAEGEGAREMQARISRQASEVRDRLHMSAMLTVGDDPAEEAEIAELYQSGWIIDATVDDVDAALKAATATPGIEDDIAARILAHRASCRYFFKN